MKYNLYPPLAAITWLPSDQKHTRTSKSSKSAWTCSRRVAVQQSPPGPSSRTQKTDEKLCVTWRSGAYCQAVPCRNLEIPRTWCVAWRLCVARHAVSGNFSRNTTIRTESKIDHTIQDIHYVI